MIYIISHYFCKEVIELISTSLLYSPLVNISIKIEEKKIYYKGKKFRISHWGKEAPWTHLFLDYHRPAFLSL